VTAKCVINDNNRYEIALLFRLHFVFDVHYVPLLVCILEDTVSAFHSYVATASCYFFCID